MTLSASAAPGGTKIYTITVPPLANKASTVTFTDISTITTSSSDSAYTTVTFCDTSHPHRKFRLQHQPSDYLHELQQRDDYCHSNGDFEGFDIVFELDLNSEGDKSIQAQSGTIDVERDRVRGGMMVTTQ